MTKTDFHPFHVLIPAAGTGTRAGGGIPKQYRPMAGKPVLRHTIEKFLSLANVKSLRVIIDPAQEDAYRAAVSGLDLPPPVMGADTRKQSVYNGIKNIPDTSNEDILLIHDAARPLVNTKDILNLAARTHETHAATLACPVADSLLLENADLPRDHILSVQTPQGFRLSLIRQAHEMFKDDNNFTDDAGLVRAMGHHVATVPGSRMNFKITTEDDFLMAEKIISAAVETRTGMGFDVHAFDPAPVKSIRIGGIDIPHTRALLGHSDADVALHALTDAILGTISAGDIGTHFPPSNPDWKAADSAIFLKESLRLLTAQGGTLVHADLTLICEHPKIGPHRDAMQKRIADILCVPPNRISIKATTSEGLGFTGRGEGIAAQAIVTVKIYG